MKNNRPSSPSLKSISDYWFTAHSGNEYALIDECEINIDACDSLSNCWNCGNESKLEKAHIVGYAYKGTNDPSNFVLLCKECHKLAPDTNDAEFMWEWIKYNKSLFGIYGFYKAEKSFNEYKKMYNNFDNKLLNLNINKLNEVLENYNYISHLHPQNDGISNGIFNIKKIMEQLG